MFYELSLLVLDHCQAVAPSRRLLELHIIHHLAHQEYAQSAWLDFFQRHIEHRLGHGFRVKGAGAIEQHNLDSIPEDIACTGDIAYSLPVISVLDDIGTGLIYCQLYCVDITFI